MFQGLYSNNAWSPFAGVRNRILSPVNAFVPGETNLWIDPSDINTLFQDILGTVPVTATGQRVLRINDKNGSGIFFMQAVMLAAPTLEQDAQGKLYLNADGTTFMGTSTTMDFTNTDALTIWAGFLKNSDATVGNLLELSPTSNNNGTFAIFAPNTAGTANLGFRSRGTTTENVLTADPATYGTGVKFVTSFMTDISQNIANVRVNKLAINDGNVSGQGTGNYMNSNLYLFGRNLATFPVTGRLYSLVIKGSASSPETVAGVENYVNTLTGATLPQGI